MTQAELNKNAVKSIFAIDDAKAQLESFGSQLDLGLPPEEDYEPKSFDDLMTVNPSTDPNYGDSSEKFADLGDDLQDEQTQKFVIDEFAKEAAKRPGNTITAADIADICGAVQCAQLAKGGQIIKGDMVSFIQDTIAKAKAAQQSQNVSDAQPNGTVADDIAPAAEGEPATTDAAPVPADVPAEDPAAVGGPAPVMEPVEPTVEPAEPSLEPNVDDGLGADPLAGGDDLSALDTGIEGDATADIGTDIPAEPAPEEGAEPELDAGNLDGLSELDNDLGDVTETEDIGLSDDKPADNDKPADDKSDSDSKDDKKDDSKDDSKDDKDDKKDDKKDDSDDDFNFEAVAKQAQALTESTEAEEAVAAAEPAADAAAEGAVPEGEAVADATDAPAATEAAAEPAAAEEPVTECGAAPAEDQTVTECGAAPATEEKPVIQEGADEAEIEAKVEAIAKEFRSNRIAERVQAQLEAYEAKEKKEKTIAQLEAVISNFEKSEAARSKSAKVESIVANFAKASKAAVEKAQLEAEAAKANELKGKLDNILESINVAPKAEPEVKPVAAPVVESVQPKQESFSETMTKIETALSTKKTDDEVKSQLESIVSDASKRSESDNIQKELDAIVESVRNA